MTDENKIFDLARKLHALATKGVDGEKDNAAQFLEKLLRDNNLTLEQIVGEEKAECRFKFMNKKHEKFLAQIIFHVCGSDAYLYGYNNRDKFYTFVKCTSAQYIEIKTKFDFYWKAFVEEEKLFYRAFIHRNKLTSERRENEPEHEPTIEELEEMERIRQMMQGMRRHQHLQRLNP